MNPLSPVTYYRRHKRGALLLVSLITLATLGLFVMVAMLDSLTLTRADVSYLTRVGQVYPNTDDALESGVISQIHVHPDVVRVIPDNGLWIFAPTLVNLSGLRLMGVSQDDLPYLMDRCGVCLKEGRLLEPRTNEMMLSEEIVRALGLRLGDQIDRSTNEAYYEAVRTPLVLVGILEGDPAAGPRPSVRVGFVSYEYLDSHELYAPRIPNYLVVAREGRKAAVDEFLEDTIASAHTGVETYRQLREFLARDRRGLLIGYGIVNCLVAVSAAVVVGVINQIALAQRVSELGLLHALGHHKRKLIRRLTLETATLAGGSWIAGLSLALLVLAWLKANVYYAKGMELDLMNLTPLWFVVPIPLTVSVFAAFGITRVFSRFDAVAVLERGKLSLEARAKGHRPAGERSRTHRSLAKPLSSLTFYLRHRRRGITLVVGTALTILVITFPLFIISAITDATKPDLEYLRYVSEVWSDTGRTVDPGVMAQIRSHPAVERVIPTLSMNLQVSVPLGGAYTTNVYGVSEQDMLTFVEFFGMQVEQGRLPRARSNEIALSESVALNRELRVGDTIGLPFYEMSEGERMDIGTPIEMVVVGILQCGSGQAFSSSDLWLGIASYEFLDNHELTPSRLVRLFVVPADGCKDELDTWLEESVDSGQADVATYNTESLEIQQMMRGIVLLFAVTEGGIAIVAAIAVATMNYIFFTQRREEFGVLHAVGRSRLWLILRTVREIGSVIAVAWLISVVVYAGSLFCAQTFVYAPKGLNLNLFNPIPWLFTLPIPLAVVVASAGTVARMLSRLDPVSIVEGRS